MDWKEKIKNISIRLQTIPLKEKLFFIANLRVMIKAGLSFGEALTTLGMQTSNKRFRKITEELNASVEKGEAFSTALARYPKVFSSFLINMVQVGEASGTLEKNLAEISLQMKKEHELLSKIRSALAYPIVIMLATIGVGVVMIVYVLPSILSIFSETKMALPLSTRILIAVSNTVTRYGIYLAIGFALLAAAFVSLLRSAGGRPIFHKILLKLPILGKIMQKVNLARFSRTLSSLLKTDIQIIKSFQITASVVGNLSYRTALLQTADVLKEGVSITESLKKSPNLFPPLVTQMISVGEKSGTTDQLLGELAEFYEAEVDEVTKSLSSIIEPIIIVFLGVVVGGMAIAVISPIYSLSDQM
ncbi:MAG: type II secretion system F family protein [Patescibacteria group bacterium]